MSNTPIPKEVKYELWWKAAGRCEFKGCNKPLYKHGVTWDKCITAENAHIIADSEKGPRGDNELSKKLAKDEKNIMLVCRECHKYIDHEGKDKYPATTLFEMKKRHEDRIALLSSINEDLQAKIVTYGARIADQMPDLSFAQIQAALLPDFYPADDNIIDLGGNWPTNQNWDEYWKREVENLEYNCKDKILDKIDRWEYKRIALFGIAPMSLLVKLGTILNNKHNVEVYQKHRNDNGSWKWKQNDTHTEYIIHKPSNINKEPVLVLSLSFSILDRIQKLKPESSIWEMTIQDPNPNFLQSRNQLYEFGRKVELLLDEITKSSNWQPLHLFLSVPVACAIEFGRVWMQKANSPLMIYDLDKRVDNIDKLAIIIDNKK